MVLYQCDRCKTEFKKKIDFTRHCKRKFPCQIKNTETDVNHGMYGTPPEIDSGSKMTPDGSKMTPNDSVFSPFFHQLEHPNTLPTKKTDQFKIQNTIQYRHVLKL